jgi:hypothetical protein
MSRHSAVLLETDRVLNKDNVDYGSRVMTNLFLKQISDTLAMIYDDGFAEKFEIVEKEKEEDDYGYYRCRYSKERCMYADDFGCCISNCDCMYKQREKND